MTKKYLSLTLLVSALMSPFLLAQTGTMQVNQQGPTNQPEVPTSQQVTDEGGSMQMAPSPDENSMDGDMNGQDMDEGDMGMDDDSSATVSPASTSSDGSTIITRSTPPTPPPQAVPRVPEQGFEGGPGPALPPSQDLSAMSTPSTPMFTHDENEFGSVSTSGGIGWGPGSVTTGKGYNT